MTQTLHISKPKSNLLDKAISYVAPSLALKRQEARIRTQVNSMSVDMFNQQRIKGVSPSRGLQDVPGTISNTDCDISGIDRARMINTSYLMFHENPLYTGILNRINNNLMKTTGIWPTAMTGNETFDEAADNYFMQWAMSPEMSGRFDYVSHQHTLCHQMLSDGDVGTMYNNSRNYFGGTKISVVDGGRIDTPTNRMYAENTRIYNGVQVRNFKPTFYWVGQRDANYWNSNCYMMDPDSFTPVRASNMNLTFIPKYANTYRGITPFISSFDKLRYFDNIMEYGLIKAKMSAVFGMVYKKASSGDNPLTKDLPDAANTTDPNRDPSTIKNLSPGLMLTIGKDDEVSNFSSAVDAGDLAAAAKIIVKTIGAGSIPANFIMNDFSDANYNGQRMAADQFQTFISMVYMALRQTIMKDYARIITFGVNSGALPLPSDGSLDSPLNYTKAIYTEPEFIAVDPEKETNVMVKRINNGLNNVSDYLIRRGKDMRKQFNKRGIEITEAQNNGMPVPVGDPGTTTMQEVNSRIQLNQAHSQELQTKTGDNT